MAVEPVIRDLISFSIHSTVQISSIFKFWRLKWRVNFVFFITFSPSSTLNRSKRSAATRILIETIFYWFSETHLEKSMFWHKEPIPIIQSCTNKISPPNLPIAYKPSFTIVAVVILREEREGICESVILRERREFGDS